jgi:hypothetical protein
MLKQNSPAWFNNWLLNLYPIFQNLERANHESSFTYRCYLCLNSSPSCILDLHNQRLGNRFSQTNVLYFRPQALDRTIFALLIVAYVGSVLSDIYNFSPNFPKPISLRQ